MNIPLNEHSPILPLALKPNKNEAAPWYEKGTVICYIKFLKSCCCCCCACRLCWPGQGIPQQVHGGHMCLPQGTPSICLLRRTIAAKRLRRPLPVQLPELILTTWTWKLKGLIQPRRTETAALEGMSHFDLRGLQGANVDAETLQRAIALYTALREDESPLENLLPVQAASDSRNLIA